MTKPHIVLQEAYANAPEDWTKKSTEGQLARLKPLLANAPLKLIKE